MDHALRRKRLADRFPELEIEALFVTRPPNVRYLTGFTGSHGELLQWNGNAAFFTDSRYEEQSRREVPDVNRTIVTGEGYEALGRACRDAGIARLGFESAGVTFRTSERLKADAGVELVPVEDAVEELRWTKDPEEVVLIERAQEITDAAFDDVIGRLREGITEREAAFELEVFMRRAGAEAIGFDTIMAFGENAAEPHHRPSDRPLRRGDVVKLDFGCVVDGYYSDMTRTVAFGEPDPKLREIHDVVRRAHLAGILAVRAGAQGRACDEAARKVIREAGYGERFGHSLGHGVGLEIHEGPTLRKDGSDILPEDAVVTVEPGVYVPGLGGVRIEDMVLVTRDACRPLPRSPKELVVL